mgnify:CR=1 FL=1
MKEEFLKRIISSILLIPITLFFIFKGSFLFNFFIIVCFAITFFEWHLMTKKISYKVIGFIFLIFSFYSIYKIRNTFEGEYWYLLFITIICVSTDIGGYIFGKTFQGPKLTKISPKKTYSGMFGGFLFSIIIGNYFVSSSLISSPIEFTLNVFIFVFVISLVSQIGDIFISYFKRLSNIKDTGKIIPGHGGILDRIDGMIFAFPASYLILSLNILYF